MLSSCMRTVNWTFGPLRYVLVSPAFHRWHHSKEAEAIDKNFATMFPIWDLIFGTLYFPKGRNPGNFGVGDNVPENLVGQMIYPFVQVTRPHQPAPVRTQETATAAAQKSIAVPLPEKSLSKPWRSHDPLRIPSLVPRTTRYSQSPTAAKTAGAQYDHDRHHRRAGRG